MAWSYLHYTQMKLLSILPQSYKPMLAAPCLLKKEKKAAIKPPKVEEALHSGKNAT